MEDPAYDTAASPLGRGLPTGSEVGGYRIGARLGSGAMGAVYSAYDGGGNLVAIKFLHAHLDVDAQGRERLRREAVSLRRLRHPAVAQILDVELDGPEAFIVTELVDGPNLEDEIAERGALDPWDLYELADQLAAALDAVHTAGVVHRDLKPSNVLVASRGPVLIDFGIAQGLDDARVTSTGIVMGTPGYLAPELLDGAQPCVDTDWWGWAALLAFAATGRAPFGVRPTDVVLARARSGRPDLAGLGPTTAGALAGALRADPALRWRPTRVVAELRRAADEGDALNPTIAVGPPTAATAVVPPVVVPPPLPVTQRNPHDGRTAAVPTGGPVSPAPYLGSAPGWEATAPYPDPAPGLEATTPYPATTPGSGATTPYDRPALAPVPLPPVFPPATREGGPGNVDERGVPPEGDDIDPGYVRPAPARRPAVVAALAVPLVLLGCLYPVVTVGVIAFLVLCARVVGVTADAFHSRRESHGVTRRDVSRAVLALPWHFLRALAGTVLPVLLAAWSGVVLVVVAGRFVTGNSARLASAVPGVDEWLPTIIAGLAVVVVVGVAWSGPLARVTRYGVRTTLARVPGRHVGTLVIVGLALALTLLLGAQVMAGRPVEWWPLSGPPTFG